MNLKYFYVCLITLVSGILYGQEELSLSDAISLGLERNYDIQIERKNVIVADNNNSWGETGIMPNISFTVNQNNSVQDNVKTAIPTQTQGQTVVSTINPGINLNWTLFSGFKARITKNRLEVLQEQSNGNANVIISNTIQAIIQSYYLVVLENERLNEFNKQLRLSRDKFSQVKLRSELGSSTSSDVFLEENNYLIDSLNFLNQQLSYRNSVRNLNNLIVETDLEKEYNYVDKLEFSNDEQIDLETLLSKLDNENIDLKFQYLSQAIIKEDLRLRRADRYPTLSLNTGFNDNRQSLNLSNAKFFTGDFTNSTDGFRSGPPDPLNSVTDSYFANLTLSITLFNGNRINRAIKNAIVAEDIANIRTDKLKTSLSKDLLANFDSYQIRRQLFMINERRVEVAQKNLDIAEDKFKNGSINSFDYRTVQNTYLSASIQRLQALYNLIDSKVSLMRLTGGIIETYKE